MPMPMPMPAPMPATAPVPVPAGPVAQQYVVTIPCEGAGAAEREPLEPVHLLWEACCSAAARAPRAVRIELFAEPCAKTVTIDAARFSRALGCVLGLAVRALEGRTGRIELHARTMTAAFAELEVRVRGADA